MKILITGCSGYIGSVICKEAKLRGHTVYGIDIAKCDHPYIDGFIQDNINSLSVSEHLANHWSVDALFHLAASADVTDSTIRPALYYSNNIGATSTFIDNLLQTRWRGPVVFSSTAAVYDRKDKPHVEHESIKPPNAYGHSKLMCEGFFKEIHKVHKLPTVMFRYFNVAGAFDDVGDHLTSDHVLQKLCNSAVKNIPFRVFGHNHNTRDGSCVRDYLHVRDVANAHFAALELLSHSPHIYTFNLGTNDGITVKELATRFKSRTGKSIEILLSDPRPGDPTYLVANPSYFISKSGFKYEYSDIDNIIDSAWEWYRSHNAF